MLPEQPLRLQPISRETIANLQKLSEQAKQVKAHHGSIVYNFESKELAEHFRDCLANCNIQGSSNGGKKIVNQHLINNTDYGVVLTDKDIKTVNKLFKKFFTTEVDHNFKSKAINDNHVSIELLKFQKLQKVFFEEDLNNLLKAPMELSQLISSCSNLDELVQDLETDPTRLFAVFQNLNLESNNPYAAKLAARLLVRLPSTYLSNPEVKKIETTLRNKGMLDSKFEPDIILKLKKEESFFVGHKAILALESPYFQKVSKFNDLRQSELIIKNKKLEILSEAYQLVIDYLYLSDEKRENFLSNIDKSLLIHIAKLADFWEIEELKERCDDELCNSLDQFNIEKEDIEDWEKQAVLFPKFAKLLVFINRVAENRDLRSIIDEMDTPDGAARLAAECTPEEIQAYSTLKNAFGQVCLLPPGTFGKDEWEKSYPITIVGDIPPLPPNIHAILEQDDPCEPGKKLKETCKLFLRPEKVILHEGGVDNELILNFEGVEELARKSTNPEKRVNFVVERKVGSGWEIPLDAIMNQLPVEASKWVLMRKKTISGTGLNFEEKKVLLKGNFEVPKVMDAIFLHLVTYSKGEESTYLRPRACLEETGKNFIIALYSIISSVIVIQSFKHERSELSVVWKF